MFPAALIAFVQRAPAPAAPPQGTEPEAAFATLRWLGVPGLAGYRVLDCRSLSLSMTSMTADATVAARFATLRADDGARLRDATPADAIRVGCDIPLPGFDKPDGPVFRAPEMEWKWDVTRWGERLLFSRAWTGDMLLSLHLDGAGDGARVAEAVVDRGLCGGDPRCAALLAQTMTLVYLRAQLAPHPIPAHVSGPERELYLYSFSVHGRAAFFAAPMAGLP